MDVQYDQEDAALRIGDTVLLYAKEAKGYVCSELSSPRHRSVYLFDVKSLKDPNFPNVHFATFKVVAANKYKAQQTLNRLKKNNSNREDDETEEKVSEIRNAEEALAAELKENKLDQERLLMTKVTYGEKVQLLHTLTKKYLCVNTLKTSRTENTNLRVELSEENSEECIFKILPRYKVRSVGDIVRYNDQAKFESFKTEGQFLHCSSKKFNREKFKVLEGRHELNLSAIESSLTLIPHYRPMAEHKPKAFRAGATVRLFHRELECYVSAEGSFADRKRAFVEDVHCRKRPSEHGKLKKPSTSANVYWQFEKESDPRSGEPLSWGERCRIKHLPTRTYLAVVRKTDGDLHVTLKPGSLFGSFGDLDTVFSLSPVIQEEDTVEVESYARIKHLQTRTWLHLEKSDVYTRTSFDRKKPGLDGLEWDSAELFKLSVTKTMNYDDAFTLEQVSEELLDNFNFVAGIVPVLTSHIDTIGGSSLAHRSAYLIKSALDTLAEFMSTPNESENKNRQKLLRNLRVLELVIEVLEPYKQGAMDERQRLVCKACYKVIKRFLRGDSRKNENYLARFVYLFKTQVRMGLNAEEVMIEMVEDNSAIVSVMCESEMDYMIEQLVETKDYRFMDFLGNLCVCANRPIPSTQNVILRKLVKAHGQEVFFITDSGGSHRCPNGENGVVYFKAPKSALWNPLTDIVCRDDKKVSEECEFLKRQLSLFARLCQGNNATAIHVLGTELEFVQFESTLKCVEDEQLNASLRSKYMELMTVMYVDVGENRDVLDTLSLSFVYDKVVENPYEDTAGDSDKGEITALTGVANVHFPTMRSWICSHLSNAAQRKVKASEVEENILLANVIEVLKLLVKYGYYDNPTDVKAVLTPLIDVLSGFTDDVPGSKDKASLRYSLTENNKPIFEIKKRAMEVLDLLFNFRLYVRLQRFIYDYISLRRYVESDEDKQQFGEESLLEQCANRDRPPLQLKLLLSQHDKTRRVDDQSVGPARERLKYLFSLSAYDFEEESMDIRSLPNILLDIANYKDYQLVQNSLHLLSRYFSTELTLFEKAIQTQLLLSPESVLVFTEVGELLPILRKHLSVQVKEKEKAEMVRILQTFTEMCCLVGDENVPHEQNQKILYNYGVLSDVLTYVLQNGKHVSAASASSDEVRSKNGTTLLRGVSKESDSEAVFEECYKFLKALAKRNPDVQKRLCNVIDDLLEVEVAVPHMAELLTEVFTGGLELCLQVTERQIGEIFEMITRLDHHNGIPELATTLQAMAKIEDHELPLRRNQEDIIKFFSKTRERFCDHVFGEGSDKLTYRWNLLVEGDAENADLKLLLTMTDLLATCGEGEIFFVESMCQTVFTIEELLKILNCPYLLPEHKRPFARFLVFVYMSGSDKTSSGSTELTNSSVMWEYLEHLGTFLENMGLALRTVPPSDTQLLREGLSSFSRRRTFSSRRKKKTKTPRTQSMSIQFVTGVDGRLLDGVLLYLSDGVLPLLKAYYKNFFKLPREETTRHTQLSITAAIVTALLSLCDHVADNFTLDSQVKLYRTTLLTIMNAGKGDLPLTVEEELIEVFDVKTASCKANVTAPQKLYNTTYEAERQLNDDFNEFVANYQQAYEGPNTASKQISGCQYDDTVYSEGDERLPLGPSFQEHVALFVKHTGSPNECIVNESKPENSKPKPKVPIPGARKIWGTMKETSAAAVSTTLTKLTSMNSNDVQVRRKFKTINEYNNHERWWFVLKGDEDVLSKLESEWENVNLQTKWKLEPLLKFAESTIEPGPSNTDAHEGHSNSNSGNHEMPSTSNSQPFLDESHT